MGRPKLPGRRDENNEFTVEYKAWQQAHQRCYNQNVANYDDYGGRGIKVHERYHSFDNFLADLGKRPDGHSLNRIDNDGDYAPGNVEWADKQTQNRNTRANRVIGSSVLTEHANNLGTSASTVRQRIDVWGWSEEDAISKPTRNWKHRLLTLNGVSKTLKEWSPIVGIGEGTLRGRAQKGWTDEQVLTTPVGAMQGQRRNKSGIGKTP